MTTTNPPFEILGGWCVLTQGAFCDCPIRSINLPKRLIRISSGAFAGCDLESIYIPENVLFIAEGAFGGCVFLEGICVDGKNPNFRSVSNTCLTKDGKTVVFGCKNSFIPSGVRHIGIQAFEDCTNLVSVEIPGSVRVINYGAFYGCSGLTSVIIPEGVEEIYDCAFKGCTSLTGVTLPKSIKQVSFDAFDGCPCEDEVYLNLPEDKIC